MNSIDFLINEIADSYGQDFKILMSDKINLAKEIYKHEIVKAYNTGHSDYAAFDYDAVNGKDYFEKYHESDY